MTTRSHTFHNHDLIVLAGAAVLVAIGLGVRGGSGAANAFAVFERDGLTVRYPESAAWFPPTGTGYPAVISSAQCSSSPKVACADQPTARIVVRVYDNAMGLGEAQAGKDHDADYGSRAKRLITAEATREIGGVDWMCTRFAYVPVAARSESVAIECSISSHGKLYDVTLSGPDAYVRTLEPEIIGHLVVK
jgi:hypothetical protein